MSFYLYIERSGTKWSMTNNVSPISTDIERVVKRFAKFPQSRLAFITIKDNSQSTRWCKIGKINDWIKRYSDCYYIVRGMYGGIHFHLLAGIKPNKVLKAQKGIHFDIKYINKSSAALSQEELTGMREDADIRYHYTNENFENITSTALDVNQQESLRAICAGIKQHFKKKSTRASNVIRRSKKIDSIQRIMSYLDKNLYEPREGPGMMFVDYIDRT